MSAASSRTCRATAHATRSSRAMVLSVWTNLEDKHAKVLNIEWRVDTVEVVSFWRGEWESELLAMGRAIPMH